MFASSCSLYDGLPPGMHDETAPIKPRGAYATSKRYGEEALLELVERGPVPGDPAQRHRLRLQPAHALRPRGQHVRQGRAAAAGRLSLHGGGWMWRPLVDVRDVSDAMIAALEAPADLVRGEIFNVLHSNYQIRELAMLVAGSVQLLGRPVTLERGAGARSSRATTSARTPSSPARLGFSPRRSVVEAVADMLAAIDLEDRTMLTDPRYYNIRWLELLNEVTPRIEQFGRAVSLDRVLITGGGGQLASDLAEQLGPRRRGARAVARRARHHRRRRGGARRSTRLAPDARLQLRRVPQRRGLRARGGPRVRGQRARRQAAGRALRRRRARGSST